MSPKKPYHELITDTLIAQLANGTAPWQKPWTPGSLSLPNNPISGSRYKGMNSIWLQAQGHEDPRWMTYKQARSVGAQVLKGQKGTLIQYWKFQDYVTKKDKKGQPILDAKGDKQRICIQLSRPRVFSASVFNAEQIDGLEPLKKVEVSWRPNQKAEAILVGSGATIQHDQPDRAFYRLSSDTIHLPSKEQFGADDKYYATALHELGHWSGHTSRLNRDLSGGFGSELYAKEELRAEIASLMIGDELGIGHDPSQHAAYVGSWIKVLQEDPKEILRAARDAEKIKDYLVSLEAKRVSVRGDSILNSASPGTMAAAQLISNKLPDEEARRRFLDAVSTQQNNPKQTRAHDNDPELER